METKDITLYASCPKGCQYALEQELQDLGWVETKVDLAGVTGKTDLSSLYRSLMWSRIANRIVLNVVSEPVKTAKDLYQVARGISWSTLFDVNRSFLVDFHGTSGEIRNSAFGGLTVKDAIVDYFRDTFDERPNVSKENPDIRVSCRLNRGKIQIGLDLAGDSLHKRGYRTATGKAPLKENLAAAILRLSKWQIDESMSDVLVDPMCGSGTILIEAAMSKLDIAPGINRKRWGFEGWKGYQKDLWNTCLKEAQDKKQAAVAELSKKQTRILGFDSDARVIARAWENIRNAGLDGIIHVEKRALEDLNKDDMRLLDEHKALVVTNPPYGERLGEVEQLKGLYRALGSAFATCFERGKGAVFTSNPDLGREVAWRSFKQYKLFNGALPAQVLLFDLDKANQYQHQWVAPEQRVEDANHWRIKDEARALMLENRLRKNAKQLSKWLRKNEISCYRLYDADIPEFAFAIDIYESTDKELWCHVQEYVAPKSVDENLALERLSEGLLVISQTLEIDASKIALKRRQVQKGKSQYERQDKSANRFEVEEGGAKYLVNLEDYLDTGLFLDHRPIRAWLKEQAAGKRVLNLFCYTASVTVQAALGGASSSLSLDMSKTYLEWGKDNFALNGMDTGKHVLERADCIAWLKNRPKVETFDLIFLDPPSFSNSKKMDDVLDVQRDHVALIGDAMRLLKDDGTLVFSTNLRKFKLSESLSDRFQVRDYTKASIDKDFERNRNIHKCWLISRKQD